MKSTTIKTNLLGRKVRVIVEHIPSWEKFLGQEATIESVYRDSEGTPIYTLSLPDGSLKEAYEWVFRLVAAE